MKYTIEYDWNHLATVEITDEAKAAPLIKEMVDFWSGGERRLAESKGDYTRAWLKQLGNLLLIEGEAPRAGREGWYPLDGSHGILLSEVVAHEFDEDLITIVQG